MEMSVYYRQKSNFQVLQQFPKRFYQVFLGSLNMTNWCFLYWCVGFESIFFIISVFICLFWWCISKHALVKDRCTHTLVCMHTLSILVWSSKHRSSHVNHAVLMESLWHCSLRPFIHPPRGMGNMRDIKSQTDEHTLLLFVSHCSLLTSFICEYLQ